MSKSNRIKGVFVESLGFRVQTAASIDSLQQRQEGITERHTPKPKLGVFKVTKTQRKQLRKYAVKGNAECHPLHRQATVEERGYAKIMGLVSPVYTQPEVSRV